MLLLTYTKTFSTPSKALLFLFLHNIHVGASGAPSHALSIFSLKARLYSSSFTVLGMTHCIVKQIQNLPPWAVPRQLLDNVIRGDAEHLHIWQQLIYVILIFLRFSAVIIVLLHAKHTKKHSFLVALGIQIDRCGKYLHPSRPLQQIPGSTI